MGGQRVGRKQGTMIILFRPLLENLIYTMPDALNSVEERQDKKEDGPWMDTHTMVLSMRHRCWHQAPPHPYATEHKQ